MIFLGSFDGVPGTLSKRLADFSSAPLSFVSERLTVIDFIMPYAPYETGLVGQNNPVPEVDIMAFILLFRYEAWMSVLVAVLTLALWLHYLGKCLQSTFT